MKIFLLLSFLFALQLPLTAQLGISGSHTWFNAPSWEEDMGARENFQGEYFFQNGFQLGLDYWFRLKTLRIEFFPEGRYARYQANPVTILDKGQLEWQNFSFHFTTNVYVFDFFGDCDCPTWSKQEPIFKKGFFLQLSPGIHYLVQSYASDWDLGLYRDQNDLAYSLGLGAGLDIGLSDWITVTPYGRLTRLFDAKWDNFESLRFFSEQAPSLNQAYPVWIPEAGIRLGLRWKH